MWRPIVEKGPAAPGTFDEHTAAAVRAFQRNMGLGTTGVVDENTRGIIQAARCGVPDNIVTPDSFDKFAIENGTFFAPGSTVTYRVLPRTTIPAPLTMTDVQTATQAAFLTWGNETSLTFVPISGSANITVQFGSVGNPLILASVNTSTVAGNLFGCGFHGFPPASNAFVAPPGQAHTGNVRTTIPCGAPP
jgi:peptidoglycan hydrolase-like protein with peptidoglycan-binding domain